MVKKNNPLAAQQPVPPFANDPVGFWGGVLQDNDRRGIASILPPGTLIQADLAIGNRLLQGQINWLSVQVRWNGLEFKASLDDGQATAPLESGGLGATGTVTLLFSKSLFPTDGRPKQQDTFQLLVGGKWKNFDVITISDGFDETDDGMIAYLEPEDSEA